MAWFRFWGVQEALERLCAFWRAYREERVLEFQNTERIRRLREEGAEDEAEALMGQAHGQAASAASGSEQSEEWSDASSDEADEAARTKFIFDEDHDMGTSHSNMCARMPGSICVVHEVSQLEPCAGSPCMWCDLLVAGSQRATCAVLQHSLGTTEA